MTTWHEKLRYYGTGITGSRINLFSAASLQPVFRTEHVSGAAKFPAHRSFDLLTSSAPAALRSKAGFKGEVWAPHLLTIRGPPTTPADFFLISRR